MHPAELGEKQAVVALIEFDLLRVRVAEAVALPLFPEARIRRACGEEVGVGPLQILQGLLHWTGASASHTVAALLRQPVSALHSPA